MRKKIAKNDVAPHSIDSRGSIRLVFHGDTVLLFFLVQFVDSQAYSQQQTHILLTNLFYPLPYRFKQTKWFSMNKKNIYRICAMVGTRDIKKRKKNEIRPRSHRAYYLWMDKEQTKRRYQYITKQETAIHVIDSAKHRET